MAGGKFERGFGFLIHDIARALRKRLDERGRSIGLTRAQWQVLANLARCEGISQGRLADILDLRSITLGRLIDRLEAAGWVERRPHPTDRRARQLFMTKKARPIFARMRKLGLAVREEALAGLSAGARERLIDTLIHVRGNLSERGNGRA
ncbi:MAG: MarR family transcriptional regulator [Proteobacteria bacterium]|nr:MarR family transcriptional regulator [Pseudomonadota bacterium]